MNDKEYQTMKQQLSEVLTPQGIAFGQAVSVCSVMIEMGLQRASIDDITDGLEQRFEGLIERNDIQNVAEHAITFGLEIGLFEPVDTDTITLSANGMYIGRDWLERIQQEAA
jgi:hypothetical protein